MWTFLTSTLSLVCGILLMFVILLQRGRGGGLAGAFGGLGGQSAFGTKAGDVFTRITIVLAVVWVLLNAAQIYAMRFESEGRYVNDAAKTDGAPGVGPGKNTDATSDETFPQPKIDTAPADEKKDDKGAVKSEEKKEAAPADKAASKTPKAEGAAPAPETKAAPTEGAAAEKKAEPPAAEPAKPAAEAPKEPGK